MSDPLTLEAVTSKLESLSHKSAALKEILLSHAPLLVAYSGGVDSTLLLAVAHQTLGDQCAGIIADSPSLPREALKAALQVAKDLGVVVLLLQGRALQQNGSDRYGSRLSLHRLW